MVLFPIFILFLYFFGIIATIAIIIYLIVKRVDDKSKEEFEKRDN